MPATSPLKLTAPVEAPLHKAWFEGAVTVGVGLTVIVKVCAVPPQPDADGVTVMVDVTAVVPALVAVKLAMLPLPLAPRPIAVLLFVQL